MARFTAKGSTQGNAGALPERKLCKSQRWIRCKFHHAGQDVYPPRENPSEEMNERQPYTDITPAA